MLLMSSDFKSNLRKKRNPSFRSGKYSSLQMLQLHANGSSLLAPRNYPSGSGAQRMGRHSTASMERNGVKVTSLGRAFAGKAQLPRNNWPESWVQLYFHHKFCAWLQSALKLCKILWYLCEYIWLMKGVFEISIKLRLTQVIVTTDSQELVLKFFQIFKCCVEGFVSFVII